LTLLLLLLFLVSPIERVQDQPRPRNQPPGGSTLVFVTPGNVSSLAKTSGTVTFGVNVSDSPSIDDYLVRLDYNTTVLSVQNANYTGNVLGAKTRPSVFCVDGLPQPSSGGICYPDDHPGVITLALATLGNQSTPAPTNGSLLHVTFNILTVGFGQVHIFSAELVNFNQAGQSLVPFSTEDGYFTNMDCPAGSRILCRPISANFSVYPPKPTIDFPATFTASATDMNAGGVIQDYTWNWGDGTPLQTQTNLAQPFQHTFINPGPGHGGCVEGGNCTVTLSVRDSYGISWQVTQLVQLVHLIQDFTINAGAASVTVSAGFLGSVSINVSSINGFAGTVSLAYVSTTGLTCSLSPASVVLGSSASSSLACTALVAGNYSANVTGTSGGLSHSTTVSFVVVGFSMSAPGGITCVQGAKACLYQVTITSINGFSGKVYLSTPLGVTVPASVSLSAGGYSTANVSIEPPRSGRVTIGGSFIAGGIVAHQITTYLTLAT
jgi:hypothetical protein